MTRRARRTGPAVVFLGPSLPQAQAREVAEAIYLPPAAQGSVIESVQRFDPSVLLIVDGSFQGEPAVRHKEILWALHLGIPVVGAASMGALRAAELWPYMQGVGLIYRWYRRFPFAPDDAVAVLHAPPETGGEALTSALVDLRMTFRAAERHGYISHEFRVRLETAADCLNFRDRTITRVIREAHRAADGGSVAEWERVLSAALVPQKQRDAMLALQLLRQGAIPPPLPISFTPTTVFLRDLEASGLSL